MNLYFDYNATTPIAAEVIEAMMAALKICGNPNSIHKQGREVRKQLEQSRLKVARLLGAFSEEVFFVSGATESNNLALLSAWYHRRAGANEILLSSVEHESINKVVKYLEADGAVVKYIPINPQGILDLSFIEANLGPQTACLTVMLANNETGFVFPVRDCALLARSQGVWFHVDAACGAGKLQLDFSEMGADTLSLSAHKFYGPKGIGVLLARKGTPLSPLILGGGQERGVRAGTENIEGIIGLSCALEYALNEYASEQVRLQSLRKELIEGLRQQIPQIDFLQSQTQLPGTLSCLIPDVRGQTFIAALDLAGVSASLGSACSSGSLDVSKVILALGIPYEKALGALRLSFGKMTTSEDVNQLVQVMGQVYRQVSKGV